MISDPFLRSVLDASAATRIKCLELLSNTAQSEPDTESLSLEKQIELSKQRKLLNAHLAQLRGMSRNAVLSVRHTKQNTAEARSEIDTLHLQLQNLYYEQRHLRGEIAACESYDHKYQQLPLISVEQFLEHNPDIAGEDENTLMVARIEHERKEREALESARQELLKKKQSLIAENKKRKDDLASLDNDLEKFIDVRWIILAKTRTY